MNSSVELDRRSFLKLAAATASTLSIAGCQRGDETSIEEEEANEIYPSTESIYLSGSMYIQNKLVRGQAFFSERNGNYFVNTVGHVASHLLLDSPIELVSHVGFVLEFDAVNFGITDPQEIEHQTHSQFMLEGKPAETVHDFMQQGILTPLYKYERKLKEHEKVAVPSPVTSSMAYLFLSVDLYRSKAYLFRSEEPPEVCEGMSGAPILRITKNGVITNKVAGLVMGGYETEPDVQKCSTLIFAEEW